MTNPKFFYPSFSNLIKNDDVVAQKLGEVVQSVPSSIISTQNDTQMTLPQMSSAPMPMLQPTFGMPNGVQYMPNEYEVGNVVTTPPNYNERDRERLLNAQIHMGQDYYRHTLRMEENIQKVTLKEESEKNKFERDRRKGLEQKDIFEDADGYLRVQSQIPGEKDVFSGRVFQKKHIKLYNVVSSEPICKIQIVTWDGLKASIVLIGKDCSSRGLAKALAANGVSVGFGHDKRRLIENQIYAYLVDHAEERYAKRNFGWCRTDHGWEFATESELTIQDILDEHARKEDK